MRTMKIQSRGEKHTQGSCYEEGMHKNKEQDMGTLIALLNLGDSVTPQDLPRALLILDVNGLIACHGVTY